MSEIESVNTQEAAEPAELEGANETEVAEPSEVEADEQTDEQSEEEPADEQDSKTNAAFAEQRRRIAELEKELAERDKATAEAGAEFEGGSFYSFIVNTEAARITEERVLELYEMLK